MCIFVGVLLLVLLSASDSIFMDSNEVPTLQAASDYQFPFMVSLRRTEFELMSDWPIHICAGALIKEQVVLTAAHCLFDIFGNYVGNKDSITVVVVSGSINADGSPAIRRQVAKAFVYAAYTPNTREADLAVLILNDKIASDEKNASTIAVTELPIQPGDKCIVLGWNNFPSGWNLPENNLQYYAAHIQPDAPCLSSYSDQGKNVFVANQFCACPVAATGTNTNSCNYNAFCSRQATLLNRRLYPGNSTSDEVIPLTASIPTLWSTSSSRSDFNLFPGYQIVPGRYGMSSDPSSILVCNSKLAGVLAYSNDCNDLFNRPQIFTKISKYADFLRDPGNYSLEIVQFPVRNDTACEALLSNGTKIYDRKNYAADAIFAFTFIFAVKFIMFQSEWIQMSGNIK